MGSSKAWKMQTAPRHLDDELLMTARTKKLFLAIAAGLTLGACTVAAQATVIEWRLQNVRFNDGGSATGFITLDHGPAGSLAEFVDWDIKITGGNAANFPPFEYTPASTFGSYFDGLSLTFFTNEMIPGGDSNQRRMLYLATRPYLTDAGGSVFLTSANTPSRESWNPEPIRIASGSLTSGIPTTIPEPSRVWLLSLGVIALFAASTRRKL